MTSATTAALDRAAAEGRAALIGYFPVGYPDVDASIRIMQAMVAGGVDILEIGVPYSDPGMDGPIIQRAVDPAVRAGVGMPDVLRAVAALAPEVAAVVMSYWNPVERYGVERFANDLAAAGGSGAITPDLIPDEAGEWLAAARARSLDTVFLVAPSSTDARLATTVDECRGFVYAASTMGVTGVRSAVSDTAQRLVARVRSARPSIRACVGLGVSGRTQAAEVAAFADGVIVGSAFVARVLEAESGDAAADAVRALAQELSLGVRDRVPACA
jgi:tryptophan synthase alpha chain